MLKSLIDYAKSAGFQGLNLGKDWPLDAAAVAAIHQAGLKCLVWTVNEPAMAKKLAGHHYGHASRAACRT